MRICYECLIMENEPHRYFSYRKGIIEYAKTQEKPKSGHCFMLTGEN